MKNAIITSKLYRVNNDENNFMEELDLSEIRVTIPEEYYIYLQMERNDFENDSLFTFAILPIPESQICKLEIKWPENEDFKEMDKEDVGIYFIKKNPPVIEDRRTTRMFGFIVKDGECFYHASRANEIISVTFEARKEGE
jgi:hypothetical protein